MLIDSHCHLDRLDLTPFAQDFTRFVAACEARQIEHLLCVCINLESYPAMRRLVEAYPRISTSVGVHPNERDCREPSVEDLTRLAADDRVVGVGETGLDYFRSEGDLEWQRDRFRRHIIAARSVSKPLIIHCREAREDTLKILAEEGADRVGGVMHCFTEDWETARRALNLNFLISFSGIVTFRNADTLRDVAKRVPEDRFLIETDSPYLAPVPFRGKPNYPLYVREVAQCIAELRGVSLEQAAECSTRNFYKLFGEHLKR